MPHREVKDPFVTGREPLRNVTYRKFRNSPTGEGFSAAAMRV
jgi:hypothetical protein